MKNTVYNPGEILDSIVTNPTSPSSGDPVRVGKMTGVATSDMDPDGTTVVNYGSFVNSFPVTSKTGTPVVYGDRLFIKDGVAAAKATITNDANGGVNIFYGFAMGGVADGATMIIPVKHVQGSGL